ncbi:hypothetical protein CROQUDRAFT_101790 [Cronartium quercuum f. sp. fusiforme G11]|uniref:Uncharacterized protein n=1 Tax=Cronartium quercuum f. sp. fusiforme G11 TaxID=708437 RepID=A0A9P6N8B3_9BASI|nr:hypothetical protein CROQUDRAFT_101790 [Cronartium quercuum f. sp. fusiforme G11]
MKRTPVNVTSLSSGFTSSSISRIPPSVHQTPTKILSSPANEHYRPTPWLPSASLFHSHWNLEALLGPNTNTSHPSLRHGSFKVDFKHSSSLLSPAFQYSDPIVLTCNILLEQASDLSTDQILN